MQGHPSIRMLRLVASLSIAAAAGTGCHVIRTTAELPARAPNTVTPGKTARSSFDPVETQQTLLRFADQFTAQTLVAVEHLAKGTNALTTAEILRLKINLTAEVTSIATGPNPMMSLLDMTSFVTALRLSAEAQWRPRLEEDAARPLLETCRNSEAEIWTIASRALTPAQQEELRTAITEWHRTQPLPVSAFGARSLKLATTIARQTSPGNTRSESVFGLLMLDPLAGMDPAVREITQTRLFAERALYVAQKMPFMLRWQTELLSLNATETPAVQQLVSSSAAISATLERFASVAEKLPDQVSAEREEILKALQAQEKDLAALLKSGTDMSDSLNTTLTTFDALMQRFGVGETNKTTASETNAEPFRILDYAETAAQLSSTAKQLTELLVTLDRTLGSTNIAALTDKVSPAVDKAEAGGKAVVDYAFWKGVLLISFGLLAALIYRFATARLKAPLRN